MANQIITLTVTNTSQVVSSTTVLHSAVTGGYVPKKSDVKTN